MKSDDPLSATFKALADPTRRAILAQLRRGSATAGELAEPFGISQPAVSRHLKVLEQAGLIERTVDRQWRRFDIVGRRLKEATDWLDRYRDFWQARFDALADFLEGSPPAAATDSDPHGAATGASRNGNDADDADQPDDADDD